MFEFICPVCGEKLIRTDKSLVCGKNHCFDKAKSGYVNLLMSQKSHGRNHGDDKLMVSARRDFLNTGLYAPLCDEICGAADKYAENGAAIFDAGCGECYYTAAVEKRLLESGKYADILGIDISKDALAAGSKRSKTLKLAVASVYKLPIGDGSCDMLFSIFSPFALEEFQRVMKSGGVLIRAIPLENHLFGLKAAVYDNPYKNEVEPLEIDGFELIENRIVERNIRLSSSADIMNLFSMTPYYYKTGEKDQSKLKALNELDTEISFSVLVYRRKQ